MPTSTRTIMNRLAARVAAHLGRRAVPAARPASAAATRSITPARHCHALKSRPWTPLRSATSSTRTTTILPPRRALATAKSPMSDEDKRRALLREDFALPLKLLRGVALVLATLGTLLGVHTTAVHLYAELTEPTPAAFDFWTRVHLRRAWMFEVHQRQLDAAEHYLAKALRHEDETSQWALWKREYLALVTKLAHVRLLQCDAVGGTDVLETVHAELLAKFTHDVASLDDLKSVPPPLAKLGELVTLLAAKLVGLYLRTGQIDRAGDLAGDLNATILPGADPRLAATELLAQGDVAAARGDWTQARDRYDAVVQLDEQLVADSADPAARVPYLEQGIPTLLPGRCLAAIAHFHVGTAELEATKDLARALDWFDKALTRAAPAAAEGGAAQQQQPRSCDECRAATLATVGRELSRAGDEVQAVEVLTQGLEVARKIGDLDADRMCTAELERLGVEVPDEVPKPAKPLNVDEQAEPAEAAAKA
ncbi:hypothetical protein AMAG_07770 [Allomyces macrogynus ATCC 38327]|uniref:MalT-like TPR region domain-containing protein n=1 Tax=Allomyces macrogynus (strain ATCC 38327) TaxID=578462 RepID=A0A0L0SJF3_ALLM3|nr:hypothetical protein AMAG_07770 [Allomyces macrogynus ATCC 38327]|eukprot:KNE62564.1 hypothetical protein AMAG_07770 [Allomyces macrogynus ATCC 38327]